MLQAVNLERKFPGATARLRPDLGCRQPPAVNLVPAPQSAGAFLLVHAVFRARDRASKAGDRRRAEARRPLGPYCRQIGARPPQRKNIPSGTHPW